MVMQLTQEILAQFEGKWIAWDTETGEVLGSADTADELFKKLEQIPKDRVLGFERVVPRDAVVVGGFWG